MSWLNAALFFVFVCNLAFMVGATFLLYRIVDAAEGSRHELKKAANTTIEAADKLHLVARRVINEMGLVNDAQANREKSANRTVMELATQVKNLTDKLHTDLAKMESHAQHGPANMEYTEDFRAKLRAELNVAVAKNHQLQDEVSQTQYKLKEAMVANRELRDQISEVKGVKQSVVDNLVQRAMELEEQLRAAQERAKAAELLAEANACQLDEIKEKINQQQVQVVQGEGLDQSGLIQSQQEQIDMLAAREKALMGRMDQMEQAFERNQAEKIFIEERFLQLDSAQVARKAGGG
jgi:hypothetical protein